MRGLPAYGKLKATGPVYITFDMDVLDPGFAPGVSHREPGGISVREAIAHLHAIEGEIVGADLVEYNPVRDIGGMTAIVAAKILKEILGRMVAGWQTGSDSGSNKSFNHSDHWGTQEEFDIVA